MDRLESAGQQRVHAVFNGILVSHIVDVDGIPQLANSLNATFPLFKPSWVPRQVEVNQGSERLQIQPFAGCIGSYQQSNFIPADHGLQVLAVHMRKRSVLNCA